MKKLFLSLLFVLLALPSFAFDIPMTDGMSLKMYGQAIMTGVYDYKNVSNGKVNNITSDFRMAWQPNSRFGINFKAGNFFANAELKVMPDQVNQPIGFREFWGGYTFSNGLTIIAGNKTINSTNKNTFRDVYYTDNGLAGFGTLAVTRRPMIMVGYAGLNVALVANSIDMKSVRIFDINNQLSKSTTDTAEEYIPRIEVAYNLKLSDITGRFAASYALFTEKYAESNNPDYKTSYKNINAFHVAFNLKPTFNNMYFAVGGFYSMNGGMYGLVKTLSTGTQTTTQATANLLPTLKYNENGKAEVQDVHTWGVAAAFGVKITDMVDMEIGGGYQSSMSDGFVDVKNSKSDVDGYGGYINTQIKFGEGHFVITPQVGYYVRQTDAITLPDNATSIEELLAGAQVKVVF